LTQIGRIKQYHNKGRPKVRTEQYTKLFEPGKIGKMQLKNRMVLPPMATMFAEEDGSVSDMTVDYYEARARGGMGLIIVEITAPGMQCTGPHQLSLGDDRYLPGWQRLAEAVHKHGAKIAVQLQHSTMEIRDGKFVQVGPSAVIVPTRVMGMPGNPPHELTENEIKDMIKWFADAAGRAKKAGLDGVEIHGAHQYLVAAFLSSATNQRNDKYGGSAGNRARLMVDILKAARKKVGPDFPLWVRLNGQEWGVDNGVTISETKEFVRMAVKAGAQAIHVSGYGAGSFITTAPIADTAGVLVPLAAEVKTVTTVPVITVGKMGPEIGEKVLREGKADFVAIGRRNLADPELANKTAEGREDEINSCICCLECIDRRAGIFDQANFRVVCTINPVNGHEKEYAISPAARIKTVAVIGGGPAGMVAARVAALRGHKVTLFEKGPALGGQLNIAALPPHKADIAPWMKYLAGQMAKTGVQVKLNSEATPAMIASLKPDAIVLAAGGTPATLDIPGIDKPNVVTADDVLLGNKNAGQKVVIIGGGTVGCETADYLAEKGKQVMVIEVLKRAASDMYVMVRRRLMDSLRSRKVMLLTSACCEAILDGRVLVTTGDGKRETIPADTVIIAVGYKPNNGLMEALKGLAAETYCIGDAFKPRRIYDAVQEGYLTGLKI
jgi:2,4-dienoyl-CoA reductase-like NADH-dependent reductase (Old Yellow Enzyme family)/thioredoxin reductase